MGFVIARAHVHDCGKVTGFKQANARTRLVMHEIQEVEDAQETENIELVDVLNTSSGKGEDGPSKLKKRNIKRSVDLNFCQQTFSSQEWNHVTYSGKKQVGRNLPKHICRAPDSVGIIELVSVKQQILLHTTVCKPY